MSVYNYNQLRVWADKLSPANRFKTDLISALDLVYDSMLKILEHEEAMKEVRSQAREERRLKVEEDRLLRQEQKIRRLKERLQEKQDGQKELGNFLPPRNDGEPPSLQEDVFHENY
jgi:hypothetical protein